MSKSFQTLRNAMSAEAKNLSVQKTQELLKDMALQELRQAMHFSQERIAEILSTKQANVSRIERRTDMYISTLRSYIEAMGGNLDIVARFPEGEIHINQFAGVGEEAGHI